MRIELSESGHSKEWKPLKGTSVVFAQIEDGPFGKDYYFLLLNNQNDLSKLLEEFDGNKELEFYFFKNILYIYIESEKFTYMIEIFDEDLEGFRKQLIKDKKILIANHNSKEEIESIFLNDIIM